MFEWKVEEMKLKDKVLNNKTECMWEMNIPRQDKIDFIAKMIILMKLKIF